MSNGIITVNPVLFPAGVPVNPFKNPFQSAPQQQSYQNWTIPESQSPFNGFGSPVNTSGLSNGFYYNHNMTNGIISQPFGGGKGGFGNPFMVSCPVHPSEEFRPILVSFQTTGSASANNPFL
jgi:hypothetical protein